MSEKKQIKVLLLAHTVRATVEKLPEFEVKCRKCKKFLDVCCLNECELLCSKCKQTTSNPTHAGWHSGNKCYFPKTRCFVCNYVPKDAQYYYDEGDSSEEDISVEE